MKIAHLTTVDMSLRFLVLPQLEASLDMGAESLGISAAGPWVEELESRGVRHVALESSTRGVDWRSDLKAMVELWRILRAERPDILHTHNPKPGVYGRIVGRLAGVPVVVNTVHGLYATEDDPWVKRMIVYILEAIAARFSDIELYQNSEDLQLMTRIRAVPRHKAVLLGNGVDLGRFGGRRWSDGERDRIRAELGVSGDTPIVGIVGRLVAEKGYPELFEAFEKVDCEAALVVVGPDDPTKPDALDRRLIEAATSRGVRFLGMRNDVEALYQAFDVFVLPSHREGFPRAAMEAAASGLPVIATDIRGCRQVVAHGVNGLLVPVSDPDALAAALNALLEDPNRRIGFGNASEAKAKKEFDERNVVRIVSEAHRRAWETRVGDWPLGSHAVDMGALSVEDGLRADAAQVAWMHASGIRSGFLSSLGVPFLERLYSFIASSPLGLLIVARDEVGAIVGYVAGTTDTARLYRAFLRSREGWSAALIALGRAFRPATAARILETLRYGTESDSSGAELLSMVVSSSARGRGLGLELGRNLLERFEGASVDRASVVVGSDNVAAIALYRRLGFTDERAIALHEESPSLEMTWSR